MLLKIDAKGRKSGGGDRRSGQSPLFSWAGATVVESMASRSFYSLTTITESVGSDP